MNTTYILILAGGVVIGILLSIPDILALTRIRRTHTVWMNSLPRSGRVEVTGKVDGNPIKSPIKKVPCVFWELKIEEEKKSKNKISWSTVLSRRSEEPFGLNDGTGKATIIPTGSELVLGNESCDDLESLPAEARAYIVSSGIEKKTFWGHDKHFRVIESYISPDQEIYVLGQAEERNGEITISTRDGGIISDSSEQSVYAYHRSNLFAKMFIPIVIAGAIVFLMIYLK